MSVSRKRCCVLIGLSLLVLLSLFGILVSGEEAGARSLRLWYKAPAADWTEALPVGNGRLGTMVFGTVEKEHIQFNEDSLGTGIPRDYSNPGAYENLAEILSKAGRGLIVQYGENTAEFETEEGKIYTLRSDLKLMAWLTKISFLSSK